MPEPVVRVRCETPKCQWVGYMSLATGHLVNRRPEGEWSLTPCPRCKGLFARYA